MKNASLLHILADLFPARERWLLAGVCVMSVVVAFFDTLGVASILPFMALVMDTSVIERSPVLQSIARTAGVTSHSEALLLFGMITAGS